MNHLNWAVFIDTHDEDLWRATLGQPDIDAWCAAHGWNSHDVASGSVNIYSYRNGHTEVTADLYTRPRTGERITVASHLRRSLPEGIGTVIR